MIDELIAIAQKIHHERYPDAEVIFLAGSLIRGEGTRTSDLDIVVVFRQLPNAYRESYIFAGWPVEAFVHDPETLNYFLSTSTSSAIPSFPAMISEGIEVPRSSEFSRSLKKLADATIAQGPPLWSAADIDASRYAITGLVDDLREPRSRSEQIATAVSLYTALANHFLRKQGFWSAKDKAISRRLRKTDPLFAQKFEDTFESLFQHGESSSLIDMAEQMLASSGGWLFENYRLPAPAEWRVDQ